jgi:hypothetical protein
VPTLLHPAISIHRCLLKFEYAPNACRKSTQMSTAICCKPVTCNVTMQLSPATCLHSNTMPCAYTAVSYRINMQLSDAMCPHRCLQQCVNTAVSCHVPTQLSPAMCMHSFPLPWAYTAVSCQMCQHAVPHYVSTHTYTAMKLLKLPLHCAHSSFPWNMTSQL